MINLEESTTINLCTYGDVKLEYQVDDRFDVMLEYIEGIAMMEEKGKNAQCDSGNHFKSWLTSVGQYAFNVFKNITQDDLILKVGLKGPKNLKLTENTNDYTLKLTPGQADTIQAKIIDLKQPFSFGGMSLGFG